APLSWSSSLFDFFGRPGLAKKLGCPRSVYGPRISVQQLSGPGNEQVLRRSFQFALSRRSFEFSFALKYQLSTTISNVDNNPMTARASSAPYLSAATEITTK